MKTVNVKWFADVRFLRGMAPRTLLGLLQDERLYLASKGVVLSEMASLPAETKKLELDFEALSRALTALTDLPAELLARFHLVRQMTGKRQLDRMIDVAKERQLDLPELVANGTPVDLAAHLLLAHPEVFHELHRQSAVSRYEAFLHFVPRRRGAAPERPTSLAALERTLDGWYEKHARGRTARVYWQDHGSRWLFQVRHGEPLKQELVVDLDDGSSGSQLLRPERHGLVILELDSGELRVHADSLGEAELFRVAFGLHLFNDGNHFPAKCHRFSLDALKRGRAALWCGPSEPVLLVALTQLEWAMSPDSHATQRASAPDVFSEIEAGEIVVPPEAVFLRARFSILVRGALERHRFGLKPPNQATFSHPEDGLVVLPWLETHDMVKSQTEEVQNGAWTLEYA